MTTYTYLTQYHTPTLSPFFASLPAAISEKLLQNAFGAEYMMKVVRESDDAEEELISLLHFLQTNSSEILIMDNLTGEILQQIPLTPENLAKKAEELLLGGSSASLSLEEVDYCAK